MWDIFQPKTDRIVDFVFAIRMFTNQYGHNHFIYIYQSDATLILFQEGSP